MTNESENMTQRLDSWLWVSRFYRTRKLAVSAVVAGHVAVNDNRSKPGKSVGPGDRLTIDIGQRKYCITILGLSNARRSAPEARALYDEPQWSREQREQVDSLLRKNRQGVKYDRKKPGKRERRTMLHFKRLSGN